VDFIAIAVVLSLTNVRTYKHSPVKVFYAIYSLQFTITQYCIVDDIYSVVTSAKEHSLVLHVQQRYIVLKLNAILWTYSAVANCYTSVVLFKLSRVGTH